MKYCDIMNILVILLGNAEASREGLGKQDIERYGVEDADGPHQKNDSSESYFRSHAPIYQENQDIVKQLDESKSPEPDESIGTTIIKENTRLSEQVKDDFHPETDNDLQSDITDNNTMSQNSNDESKFKNKLQTHNMIKSPIKHDNVKNSTSLPDTEPSTVDDFSSHIIEERPFVFESVELCRASSCVKLDDITNPKYFDYFLTVSEVSPKIDYKDIADKLSKGPILPIMENFERKKYRFGIDKIKDKFHVYYTRDKCETEETSDIEEVVPLTAFVDENFSPAGSDLECHSPVDYVEIDEEVVRGKINAFSEGYPKKAGSYKASGDTASSEENEAEDVEKSMPRTKLGTSEKTTSIDRSATVRTTKDINDLLSTLNDPDIITIAIKLHERWKVLCQRRSPNSNPGDSSTLLDLPHPFFVPGGRFREFYYWDTYWVLKGLIVSGMNRSVTDVINNFIFLINKFGFIPNGSRSYYLNRSQPPYFLLMLEKAVEVNPELLKAGVEAAEKEYKWWMKNRRVVITRDKKYVLNMYRVIDNTPRLESFKEDLTAYKDDFERTLDKRRVKGAGLNETSESANVFKSQLEFDDKQSKKSKNKNDEGDALMGQSTEEKSRCEADTKNTFSHESLHDLQLKIMSRLFSNIKTAAESGWDFSSRWLTNDKDIGILNQVPVDLNALLWKYEQILSKLHGQLGNVEKAKYYKDRSDEREEAINSILWNKNEEVWMDWNFKERRFQDKIFYFSNLAPLVYGIKPLVSPYKILDMYKKELFFYPGGIPASGEGVFQSQQWDFPNLWAPHQHMAVEMLLRLNEPILALDVAKRFYQTVLEGYRTRKDFDEKYLCKKIGEKGDGGEYMTVSGFGWTNGTILDFISQFGDKLCEKRMSYDEIKKMLNSRSIEP